MKSILTYSILLFSALQALAQAKREIFFADVTIYVEGDKYYLTGSKGGSGGPQGFAFLESKDLKTWAVPAQSNDSLGTILTKGDHAFGTKGFWAPQVFKVKGTYYLTYTADEQTVFAESKSLLGPYREVANIPGKCFIR
jgi:xylan 1,4-beta-xylosidase